MKKLIGLIMIMAICLGMASCGYEGEPSEQEEEKPSRQTECHLGETVAFENGVEFAVVNRKFATEQKIGYTTYKAPEGNKYVFVLLKVANNSKSVYSAEGTDIWLDCDGARILQQTLVKKFSDGFNEVAQSPTTTVEYIAVFQVGEQVEFSDLALVIDNGSWLDNEQVKIWLTEK